MISIPGYSDLVLIGEGGLGRVYRATRTSTGGIVAIKELRDVAEASPAWHRALREVEAMLRLKGHSHVVSVEEVLHGPNGPLIVMEYMPGGSLFDRLSSGPLPIAQLVLVGDHVSQAIAAAHRVGVIHRDIKPHNLLVSGFGEVKVADFGISAMIRQSGQRTQTTAVTLAYASPEELDGADDVGPATDAYSLSATLSHLATGRKPSFRDREPNTLALGDSPSLSRLSAVIRGGLALAPEERPSMDEYVAAFAAAQAELGSSRSYGLPAVAGAAADAATVVRPPQPSQPSQPPGVQPLKVVPPGQSPPTPPPGAFVAATVIRPTPTPTPTPTTVAPAFGVTTADHTVTRGRRGSLVIASFVIIAVLIGVAVFALTRKSSSDATSSSTTQAPAAAPVTQTAPNITAKPKPPPTTKPPAAAPTTVKRVATTTTPTVPTTVGPLLMSSVVASASSVLDPQQGCRGMCTYGPRQVLDGNPETAWAEGSPGDGVGQSISFQLRSKQHVVAIQITPGWQWPNEPCLFLRNSRPAQLTLSNENGIVRQFGLADGPGIQSIAVDITGRQLTLTVTDVYGGQVCGGKNPDPDMLISDVSFDVLGP